MSKGYIISFEGIDKAGKTTQARMLFDYFQENNISCNLYSLPSDFFTGKLLREYLSGEKEFSKEIVEIIHALDKSLVSELILEEKIKNGEIIILDRWIHSTFAYGQALGHYLGWLMNLNMIVRIPDLVIYLRIDIDTFKKRAQESNLEIYENIELQEKVLNRYEHLFRNHIWLHSILEIDGKMDKQLVFERVKEGIGYALPSLRTRNR